MPHFHAPTGEPGDDLALRPILDAIGLRYGTAKLGIHSNVVITEGITDLYYYRAFNALLSMSTELHIAPGRGDDKILNIVALVISQGLAFKIVVDKQPTNSTKDLIQARYGIPDLYFYEVPLPASSALNQGSGVEDLFSKYNFETILTRMGWTVPPVFTTMSNAGYMNSKAKKASSAPSTAPSKRVVADWFVQQVRAGNLTMADFEPTTVGQFKAVLDFCHNDEWCLL